MLALSLYVIKNIVMARSDSFHRFSVADRGLGYFLYETGVLRARENDRVYGCFIYLRYIYKLILFSYTVELW